ncbi:Uncharacterised protein [Serratia fonticola]|nr:Uncharacterised protein [Serratia fonticola]
MCLIAITGPVTGWSIARISRCFGVSVGLANPVFWPCITHGGITEFDSIDVQMRALRAERHQRTGYEWELLAAKNACD